MPIGKLEPFDVNSKQWPAYVRRVKQFILLNEIKDELKVPTLITVVGEATYALMCDLCSPEHPESKTFDRLVQLVSDHLEPQRSEIAERHVFRLRRQRLGEPLVEYLQNLKHLAATCNFGISLEENLRDQFVSGLASEAMRSRIFAERNIKYKAAVELALALEAAEKHAEVSGATGTASATTSSAGGGDASGAGDGLHQASVRRGGAAGGRGTARPVRGAADASGAAGRCWRCGKAHRADRCRYAHYNCDECNRRGHLKVMCKSVHSAGRPGGRQNYVSESDTDDMDFYNIELSAKGNKPYFLTVTIEGRSTECEVDTGSRISAISEDFYRREFSHKIIQPDNLLLRCYAGSRIESLGFISVNVRLGDITAKKLALHVIKNGGRPLLGREWLRALNIRQINFNEIAEDRFVNRLAAEFPDVFTDKLGTCKKTIQLELTDCEPVYVRARPVPLALRTRVEAELSRLEREGTIYRVEHSDYGTPIVPVIKECGDIRICGDYKITINPKLKRDHYPLPRIEELFACLSGGEEFSKIDLKHSYQQVLLTEDSQPYTAITTHIGTFVYRRTPFGLSCVPEKFQKLMEETLRGVPGTVVFLDDVCVTGATRQQHLSNLRAVLGRLSGMGFTIKLNKCTFLQKSVKYLGFVIDKLGLHPDPVKLEAISAAPRPENVTQLKSFLGLLNYYGKFINNLALILHPLHLLLKKSTDWQWDSQCEKAFNSAKNVLLSDKVLAHYEEGRPLVLSVDSSAYGLGAVLAHVYPDGSERPVSCVSRTLNSAEKNYSQLDKEALAIFYGVTRHHQYLFGRRFTLRTDHRPLSYIFGEKGGIPQTAASRLQRWAARLAAYDFKVEFVRGRENGPADALSRLPLHREVFPSLDKLSYIKLVEETIPVNFREISKETKKDKLLSRIVTYVMFEWPSAVRCDDEKPYFNRRSELVVELGCLIYKFRVVIPPSLRKKILAEIHEGHLGVVKMKNLSRNYVYWPSLDKEIEELCRSCEACRAVRDAPPRAPLHPWEFPLHPWHRLHADFAECAGNKYLIMVDAHTKWLEVACMNRTDADSTINVCRTIFARFGLPSQLVTDNGPPFTSYEFKEYCNKNNIRHVTTAPYRPQGNGAAENAVKTVKKVIKRARYEGEKVSMALDKFLFQYRNCEHATTGVSPAVALLGRRLRGRLDAVRPDVAEMARKSQARQVANAGGVLREFQIGDPVCVRNYSKSGEKWVQGKVTDKTGPVSYKVKVGEGVEWRRHQDQVYDCKNRYSLARSSAGQPETGSDDAPPANDDDADETFEDASSDEGMASATPKHSSRSPVDETPSSPSPPPPLTPNASARALRAYNRAKKV